MTTLIEFYKSYSTHIPSGETKPNTLIDEYLSGFDSLICVYQEHHSYKILSKDAMECFIYSFPNKRCTTEQFRMFSKIVNKYVELKKDLINFEHELLAEKNNSIALPQTPSIEMIIPITVDTESDDYLDDDNCSVADEDDWLDVVD